MIFDYIMAHGRPSGILVRDMYSFSILLDLCKRLDIDIMRAGHLLGIDEFVNSLSEML